MDDTYTYLILLHGQVDEADVITLSSFELSVELVGSAATLLTVQADQSGLIGLLRCLHGMGITLISVIRAGQR